MKKLTTCFLTLVFLSACNTENSNIPLPEEQSELTTFKRDIISRALGDAPNFAQTANGNFSAVVSRGYGRGAKAGAIIEFLYPLYARDHLWDAYNGIYYNDKLSWFHEMNLLKQSVKDDTGIIISEFKSKDNKLNLKTSDVALRDSDTLVRHLEITNKSNETINNLKLFFYEFLTVNYLGAGDSLSFEPEKGVLNHSGSNVNFTVGSDQKPEQWQAGGAENLLTNAYDARKDAEDGKLKNNLSSKGGAGLGVNGNLGHSLKSLKAGEKFVINYYISAGKNSQESFNNYNSARAKKWENIEQQELSFWKNWLAKAKKPVGTDERINRVYRRALITLKQDTANNGAVIASPTLLTPVYAFTWPRDGSVTASFLAS